MSLTRRTFLQAVAAAVTAATAEVVLPAAPGPEVQQSLQEEGLPDLYDGEYHLVTLTVSTTKQQLYLDKTPVEATGQELNFCGHLSPRPRFYTVSRRVNFSQQRLTDIAVWDDALTQDEINELCENQQSLFMTGFSLPYTISLGSISRKPAS